MEREAVGDTVVDSMQVSFLIPDSEIYITCGHWASSVHVATVLPSQQVQWHLDQPLCREWSASVPELDATCDRESQERNCGDLLVVVSQLVVRYHTVTVWMTDTDLISQPV